MARTQPRALAALTASLLLAGALPASAGFEMERELPLEPGGRFVLDADGGRVTLRGSDRGGVRVRITSPRDDIAERYRFEFSDGPDRAALEVTRRGSWLQRWRSWRDDLRFEIELPRRADLDITTAGGAIEAESIDGTAELATSGGAIRLAELAGRVEAHTSGGSIGADGIDGDLTARTSGGSIRVREVTGKLMVDTSGGSVTAHLAAGNQAGGRLSTSGGSVTAYIDPAAALAIDAAASGGGVVVDPSLPIVGRTSRGAVRGELNGGGATLVLRSSGGGIRLRIR